MSEAEALINYQVRVSLRGRNVRLEVTPKHGLEVIVPRGYDTSKVPEIIKQKNRWIRNTLERFEAHRKYFEPDKIWRVPSHINLPALGKVWNVTANESDESVVTVREVGTDELVLSGQVQNEQICRFLLVRWLKRQTRIHLVPRLHTLSLQTGLRFHRILVKRQKTRWASCSVRGTISLNVHLLFLPPELVDYVMIHELCHTVEMNHSKKFWKLVGLHSQDYKQLDRNLRDMWKAVPRWAMAE